MNYLPIILLPILFLFLLLFLLIFHFKKKRVIKKVCSLTECEKKQLLDELGTPLGYTYEPHQDIFIARKDALQKTFGYTTFFDLSAPFFNMIFDYETVYFNYNSRTWLIEMWKGQYGINSGCELGIYYADSIISPNDYEITHFKSVEEKDILELSLSLNRYPLKWTATSTHLGHMKDYHWWLTIFHMGVFSKPKNLFVNTSIRFRDYAMMNAFLDSFEKELPHIPYQTKGFVVSFTFSQSLRTYSLFRRAVRSMALFFCHIYCKWFLFVTRPFANSGDKLLYLYFYLPSVVRRMFRQNKKN